METTVCPSAKNTYSMLSVETPGANTYVAGGIPLTASSDVEPPVQLTFLVTVHPPSSGKAQPAPRPTAWNSKAIGSVMAMV